MRWQAFFAEQGPSRLEVSSSRSACSDSKFERLAGSRFRFRMTWTIEDHVFVGASNPPEAILHGRKNHARSNPDGLCDPVRTAGGVEFLKTAEQRTGGVRILWNENHRSGQRHTRTRLRNIPARIRHRDLATETVGGAAGLGIRRLRAHQHDALYDQDSAELAGAAFRSDLYSDRAGGLVGFGNFAHPAQTAIDLKAGVEFAAAARLCLRGHSRAAPPSRWIGLLGCLVAAEGKQIESEQRAP